MGGIVDLVVWGVALAVVVGLVIPYAVAFRRRERVAAAQRDEAVALGVDKPKAQYPYVDPTLCIGCGTCVTACPEGDVLAVVGGTATIVNGLRCIGIAKCEPACPVDAITVGLGDVRDREDMPLLTDSYESTVDGVYVIGELGGLALIRFALEQGRDAAVAIDRRLQRDGSRPELLDMLVVGAGPAGLAAALEAQARGRTVCVLEQESDLGGTVLHYPRRKLVLTQPAEIPNWGLMDREEYTKEELLELFQECVTQRRLPIEFSQRVVDVSLNGHATVRTEAGEFNARTVVLATGRRGTPRKLGVPGEEQPHVMYRLIDAAAYAGQRVLVVGGGDSAVEAAAALAEQGRNQVMLSYRKPRLLRVKRKNQELATRMIEGGLIDARFESVVSRIDGNDVVLSTDGREESVHADYVFVFIGGEPPFPLLKRIGIRFGGETGAGLRS